MGKKCKVLTINWTGIEGSTHKLIKDIEERTKDSCEYFHCYQVGERGHGNCFLVAPWNVTRAYYGIARVVGLKYGVGTLPTIGLLRYINQIKPDVIHVHCPNFYNINLYMLFDYLKRKSYPVIITNHAEFFYTGNCAHAFECNGYMSGCKKCTHVFDTRHKYLLNRTHHEWKKMRNAFKNADHFIMTVVSQWQADRVRTSPIARSLPIKLIENAVNTDIFRKKEVTHVLADRFDITNNKIILHVTSCFSDDVNDVKGGHYIIDLAKEMQDSLFLIAGNIQLRRPGDLSSNVILLGNVLDQESLSDYYNIADLTVLTSRRETFGMACAESMVCGTPVVGFKAGGTESIAIPRFSEFVEYGNVHALKQTIYSWIDKKASMKDELAAEAAERYSAERMAKQYLELYIQQTAQKQLK